MQTLWVVVVAGEGVHSVESAVERIVVSCPQVILLSVQVELFASIQK